MKKVKTIVLDLALALGLLVATGAAAGVLPLPLKGEGSDIFGGATAGGCSYWIYGPSACSGSGSGCVYTPALCGGTLTAYKSIWQVPCGAYACGTVWRSVNCVSGT